MKKLLVFFACALAAAGFSGSSDAKTTLVLKSAAFADGGTIPHDYSQNSYGCTGKNTSPELHWLGAPSGTKSFALTVFDTDAGNGKGWWHWVVYNINPEVHKLAAGETSAGSEGGNDFGATGYGGPCPPPGDAPHHYAFTLYALSATLSGSLDGPALLDAVKGKILAKAVLVGRFGR